MLELKLFGTGQARYFDQPIEGFPFQQAYLIFCYLVINKGQPYHRERLAAVFWGDYPTLIARKYLRNSLWRLRQSLESMGVNSEQYLQITEGNIAFVHHGPYSLDIESFETITSHYQAYKGEDLRPEQAHELTRGIELYTGDLLESVYQDWCLVDRERLRLAYLDALTKLMIFHTSLKSYEQGVSYGERILALDPLQERVHRQIMIIHWLSGNPYAALAQYKRCSQILQDEMQIHPMEETRLLYEKMLHNQFEQDAPSPKTFAIPPKSPPIHTTLNTALQHLDNLQEKVNQLTEEIRLVQNLIQTMPE